MDGYKGLKVYEKSYELALEIYKVVKLLPKEEIYGLSSQMRRASTSIPINIAEGYSRKANAKEYRQFVMIAQGSANEMQVLLDLCKDLGYIKEEYSNLYERYTEILKMLSGIIRTINIT